MRLIINLALVALVALLIYALYDSIREPIAFKDVKETREQIVQEKLTKIRVAQEAYRDIMGVFAPTFDSLALVLNTGNFTIINVNGDPDDPNFTGEVTYETILRPAKDSMLNKLGIKNFASLAMVPFGNGAKFDMEAMEIEYQGTKVPVVQVGTPYSSFMGSFGSLKYSKYDQKYDPANPIKFGNLNSPNLAGNW
jgi:hypothetical protein